MDFLLGSVCYNYSVTRLYFTELSIRGIRRGPTSDIKISTNIKFFLNTNRVNGLLKIISFLIKIIFTELNNLPKIIDKCSLN